MSRSKGHRAGPCAALLLVCASLGALGCANGRVSEQDDIAGTVRTFLDQCAQGRALRVLPELVPAAQDVMVHAGSVGRGCATLLGAPAVPTARELQAATVRVTAFDGARARVSVDVAGRARQVELSRGNELWRIEGR